MIPEEKQPAVRRALTEAFGVSEFEDIHLTAGGLSPSRIFRIVVGGQPYLLRIILRSEVIADPAVELACMKIAAEAGIAPRIWYASLEDKVLITDFVERKPFPDDVVPLIAPVLRKLHALPGFPKPRMGSYFDAMDGFVRRFQAANLLPESATGELFRHYAELVKVYPRNDAEYVASHNDLKPQNMVFDGNRLWLVDWESAFLNDRYADLAVVANFFVTNNAQEEALLNIYFGEPAGEYRRARFYLMRQAMHMFYASLLILLAVRSGLTIDADLSAPDFREYHRRLIADLDEVNVATAEGQVQYAKVHLNEALRNMRSPRFAEAVALVGGKSAINS